MKKFNTETNQAIRCQVVKPVLAVFVLSLVGLQVALPVQAESLFRASTTYTAPDTFTPRSLFTPPISRQVGDLVTIVIEEETLQETSGELKITRNQVIDENGSTLYNGMLGFILDKLPFKTSRIERSLQAPTFNGLDNRSLMNSKAETKRRNMVRDHIGCQVVQVLPNGDLVVQGQKTIQINKERGDLIITGIVRPFYLTRENEISSRRVANLQMIQGGKGTVSRQQNDGIANKIYQFFN